MIRFICDRCGREDLVERRLDLWEEDPEDRNTLNLSKWFNLCSHCKEELEDWIAKGHGVTLIRNVVRDEIPEKKLPFVTVPNVTHTRECVMRMTEEGYSAKEIAEATGYTIASIYQIRHQERGSK